jgi:ACR3 family arsenite efflux pump ArsB
LLQEIFVVLRKYLPWLVLADIIIALLVGNTAPQVVKSLKPWKTVPLFFMLYPMMINFRIENAAKALRSPKVVLAALVINFVISPPLAALFAHCFFQGQDPYLLAGFILKVTVAGSGMVAAWTGFAKGRVETTLSIIAVGFLVILVAVPAWMVVLAGSYVPVDFWLMVKQLALVIVLPLAAGMLTRYFILRHYGEATYKKFLPALPAISSLGMYAIVFIAVGMEAQVILKRPQIVLLLIPAILVLYSLIFVITIAYARVAGLDYEDAIALGYSTTGKNHSITLAISMTAFGRLAPLPAAFAPIVQIPLMILILKLAPWLHQKVFPSRVAGELAL